MLTLYIYVHAIKPYDSLTVMSPFMLSVYDMTQ